ncbi:MAG: Lrp/AsnC ligand binding domain-containing protein [Anaerolineae bacterium]
MGEILAYILIEVQAGRTASVQKHLQARKEVLQSHIVTGPYDIIALAKFDQFDDLPRFVLEHVQTCEGVLRSTTCVAVNLG